MVITARLAAATLAAALFALALLPRAQAHALLDPLAGHALHDQSIAAVQRRAAVCGGIALLIAAAAPLLLRLERGTLPRERISKSAIVIIAVGVVVRVILLFGPPHYDECYTVTDLVWKSPLFFLSRYPVPNNHVFQTLLVWCVWLVAGNRLWALRLPAFLCGIAILPATYLLARRAAGERAALLATALAAGATPLIEYSAQARGYTLVTLAFLLLFLIDDDRVRALLVALGAWTMPTMLFAAAAWALWMAVAQRAWRRIAAVAAASAALTFLLYLPILVFSSPASITSNGTVQSLSFGYRDLLRELPRSFADGWQRWSVSFTLPFAIVAGCAALVAMARRRPAGILLATAIVAIVPLLLLTQTAPFSRIWTMVLPLYLIAAADTFAVVPRAHYAAAAIAVLTAANALRCTSRESFIDDPELRDVARIDAAIRALPADACVFVTPPLDSPIRLYHAGAPQRIVAYPFLDDAVSTRAALAAARHRYFAGNPRGSDLGGYLELALPYALVPAVRFPHAVLYELQVEDGHAGEDQRAAGGLHPSEPLAQRHD